ncbi:MAG: putative DNA binding domain-containing protein [Chitinophagaceae bacterium]|nr:putative DNA binding domain-containing protein [Chitinophagaceae bacterium]
MTEAELTDYLQQHFPAETEKCEWKEYKNLKHCVKGHAGNDVISYVSALANMKGGHLIIGVEDQSLKIAGIQDFNGYTKENIKLKIVEDCTNLNSEDFIIEEFITSDTDKTVWVLHIHGHQFRKAVYAHRKAWQRIGDSLVEITQARMEAIVNETNHLEDWTASIVADAVLDDLDKEAVQKARLEFRKRNHPKYGADLDTWSDTKFLDKAKLTIKGKITRAALILLGKEEAEHFLGSFVKIRWNLKTVQNQDKDAEIFSIPLILSVDSLFQKIRNLKYRYLRQGTLFPDEIVRYDAFSIREPLNNAIAHQDYAKGARINVVEFEDDHLVFSNYGSFLPKSVEEVVLGDSPEEIYRNPFLVEAMKNLNMIETQGGGIRKIFQYQRQRFFPLPDYDLADGKVKVTITGKILDEEFAKILASNPAILLEDIILLDKVQKRKHISDEEFRYLKKRKLIEGRKGNIFLSLQIIEPTDNEELKAEYMANRSFDDQHFKKMILDYLNKFGSSKRAQIDNLIIPKLSAALTVDQKKNKVRNFLTALRMEQKIQSRAYGTWELL